MLMVLMRTEAVRIVIWSAAIRVAEMLLSGCPLKLVLARRIWLGRAHRPVTAHRSKRLSLQPLDLRRIGATCALEVQMLADRVVQQTHVAQGNR